MTDTLAARIEALAPCPFCGGEDADFVNGADDDGQWVAVACPDCGVATRQHYSIMEDARPHAQNAWNTRPAIVTALRQAESNRDRVIQVLKDIDDGVYASLDDRADAIFAAVSSHIVPADAAPGELAAIVRCMDQMLADPRLDALAFDKHDSRIISEALRQAEAYPQHIGDLHLGEDRSDGERMCRESHEVPVGHPLYWPQQISQYDDSDPCCLEHAIEHYADHSSGYPDPLRQAEAARRVVEALCARLVECGPANVHNGKEWVGKPYNRDGVEAAALLLALARQHGAREDEVFARGYEAALLYAKDEGWACYPDKLERAVLAGNAYLAAPATDVGEEAK